jgi:hypothetical protein
MRKYVKIPFKQGGYYYNIKGNMEKGLSERRNRWKTNLMITERRKTRKKRLIDSGAFITYNGISHSFVIA